MSTKSSFNNWVAHEPSFIESSPREHTVSIFIGYILDKPKTLYVMVVF
jgi:hypothetical protein